MLKFTYVGDIMIKVFPELIVPLIQNNQTSFVKKQEYRKIEQITSTTKNNNHNRTNQDNIQKKDNNIGFDNILQEEIKKLI